MTGTGRASLPASPTTINYIHTSSSSSNF